MSQKRKSMKGGARKSLKGGGARKSLKGGGARKSIKGGEGHAIKKNDGGKGKGKGDATGGSSPEEISFEKRGNDKFTFKNGDVYVGEFLAVYPDIFVRDGQGVYSFTDGTKLSGKWEKDLLVDGEITWPDGHKYKGELREGMYHGQGTYTYPDYGELNASFIENKVTDKVAFTSKDGLLSTAIVETGETSAELSPVTLKIPDMNDDEKFPARPLPVFPDELVEPQNIEAAEEVKSPEADKGKNQEKKSISGKRQSMKKKSIAGGGKRKSMKRQSMKKKSIAKK